MSHKRPPERMNDTTDKSYRAEDAYRVPNAEPGFDARGQGLGYVDANDAPGSTYAKAQAAPTAGYPDDEGISRR